MNSQGGVIMDVVNAEQARIAEEAGACAVMALERVPADIRASGGVARMVSRVPLSVMFVLHLRTQSDPQMIKEIVDAVTIPVMAKVRIGHFVEAQVREPSSRLASPSSASWLLPSPRLDSPSHRH